MAELFEATAGWHRGVHNLCHPRRPEGEFASHALINIFRLAPNGVWIPGALLPITVLIADDDAGFREALADSVTATPGMIVVGFAADGEDTVTLARTLKPNVVLMDVRMPGRSGPEATRGVLEVAPEAAVLALSVHEDSAIALSMLEAGALGYLVKGSVESELLDGIRRAARGQMSISAELGMGAIRGLLRQASDRREAGAALIRNEVAFNAIFEAGPDALLVLDPDGTIRQVNAQVERLSGFRRDELVGRCVDLLLPEFERKRRAVRLARSADRNEIRQATGPISAVVRHRDGRDLNVDVCITPLSTAAGTVVVAALRDVTELRLSLEVQRRSEELFRGLLESAPDAMVLVDQQGAIQLVNARVEELFGYARSELVGQSVDTLLPQGLQSLHVAHRDRFGQDPVVRPMGLGLDLRARRKDGTEVAVDISLSPVNVEGGPLILAAVRDITERREAERVAADERLAAEEKRQLENLFRIQDEERLRIASDIHDDTIQAMSASVLRLQQMRQKLTDSEQLKLMGKLEQSMRESINRLRRLMFDLHPASLEHSGLAAALRDLLAREEEETGLLSKLDDTRIEDELPPLVRTTAYRIASEALVNVRKHSEATSVSVLLESIRLGSRVTISDNGKGFNPVKAPAAGGHLGLTGMRERARIAGGGFEVKSQPGGGTEVKFWLPHATALGGEAT